MTQLEDLRAPMSVVLESFADQLAELQRYKARFGELGQVEGAVDDDDDEEMDEEGSETE